MPNGYSNDLRERVVSYYDDHHTQKETCAQFSISYATLTCWLKLRWDTGSIDLKPCPSNRKRKLDGKKLKAYIAEHPDAYLREIAEVFDVSVSSVWFQEHIRQFEGEQLVWVDECGLNRDLERLYGRCARHQLDRCLCEW